MCSGSEEGSYLRLIDFVYHSTLGVRIIKKKKKHRSLPAARATRIAAARKALKRVFIEHLTSDSKLKASREGSQGFEGPLGGLRRFRSP